MRVRRKPGVTSETVDGEAVLIGPDAKEVIAVNAVGTLVWEALASPRDTDDLVDELLGTFDDVGRDELQRDVRGFLSELREADLIEEID